VPLAMSTATPQLLQTMPLVLCSGGRVLGIEGSSFAVTPKKERRSLLPDIDTLS
jgi:hypothetical protein